MALRVAQMRLLNRKRFEARVAAREAQGNPSKPTGVRINPIGSNGNFQDQHVRTGGLLLRSKQAKRVQEEYKKVETVSHSKFPNTSVVNKVGDVSCCNLRLTAVRAPRPVTCL